MILAKLIIFRYLGGCKLSIQLLVLPIVGSFCSVAPPRFGKRGGTTAGLGATLPAANEFYDFYIKKHSFKHTFFIEKEHAVSAVTMDNAKMIAHFMSNGRSSAKISEGKLQPLLV